jgi:predicted phage terminase large subunit-like protein
MPYEAPADRQTRADHQFKALSDPIFLGKVMGYDFQEFHRELFEQLPPVPVPGKALSDLSDDKFTLVLWPRGHFKTSATVVRIIQIILNDPDTRIMLMSANQKLTKNWMAEIRSHVRGDNPSSKLLALFPELRTEKGSAMAITIATRRRKHLKDPTLSVATPKAVATGAHCDYFFADDLVHVVNYRNVELQDKLEEDFSHFVPLVDPGGYTCATGTRYTGADVYGRFIKKTDKWKVSIKKARWVEPGTIVPTLLFPQTTANDGVRKIGFTNELLDSIQKDDPVTYAAQYLNEIHIEGRQIFPQELVLGSVRSRNHPDFPQQSPVYFSLDLAETSKDESDHSVIAIGRRDVSGSLWIEDVVGSNWTPNQTATVLINLALKYRPERIFVQKAFGAETFIDFVHVLCAQAGTTGLAMELVKISNQKDAKIIRISSLAPEMRNKRLFLCAGIRDFDRLEEEFEHFPKGRHDDRPDAIETLATSLNRSLIVPTLKVRKGPDVLTLLQIAVDEPMPEGDTMGNDFTC